MTSEHSSVAVWDLAIVEGKPRPKLVVGTETLKEWERLRGHAQSARMEQRTPHSSAETNIWLARFPTDHTLIAFVYAKTDIEAQSLLKRLDEAVCPVTGDTP